MAAWCSPTSVWPRRWNWTTSSRISVSPSAARPTAARNRPSASHWTPAATFTASALSLPRCSPGPTRFAPAAIRKPCSTTCRCHCRSCHRRWRPTSLCSTACWPSNRTSASPAVANCWPLSTPSPSRTWTRRASRRRSPSKPSPAAVAGVAGAASAAGRRSAPPWWPRWPSWGSAVTSGGSTAVSATCSAAPSRGWPPVS